MNIPDDDIVTLQAPPDPKDYYIIEVLAGAYDWIYILHRMARIAGDFKADEAFVSTQGPNPVYFYKRSRFTAEQVGKALGVSPTMVEASTSIKLKPISGQDGWQKPTVPYIGEA